MKALILALALFSVNAAAESKIIIVEGQETQNGGGAAEQTFAYALTVLKPLYQMCLAVDDCVKVKEQRAILQKIHDSMDQELASPALLRFAATWWPEFMRDGQVRVAVTGSKVGDTIYLNRDLIYSRRGTALIPYSVSEALSLLTHELGHHQGEKDHELLDMLGANVRAFFDQSKETLVLDLFANRFASSDIRLNVFHTRQTFTPYAYTSAFWLSVGESFFDLNPDIKRQMSCDAAIASVPTKLNGFRFFQMHWGERVGLPNGRIQYPVEAKVWVECAVSFPDGHTSYMAIPHRARLFLDFIPVGDGNLIYVDRSLRVDLVPEKQY
jgi:hypothetical protein